MVADLGAHFEKPNEMSVAMPNLRGFWKEHVGAYGGGAVSLIEHLRTGYKLDNLDPKNSPTDRRTIKRQREYGKAVTDNIVRNLIDSHDMKPRVAKRETKKFLATFNPSTSGEVLGDTSRTGTYLAEQAVRAGKALARKREGLLQPIRSIRLRTENLPKIEAAVKRARTIT